MEDENKVEVEEGTTPEAEIIQEAPSQNPVEVELDKEKGKIVRTEPEKAAFTLQKNAERAKELGLDPAEVLGIKAKPDGGTPMTVEMYEQLRREEGQKTSLQLAEGITDEKERELTKRYLKRVVPSGDPQEDLRFARLAVNSVKNGQILEEVSRAGVAKTHISGAGAPAKKIEQELELTSDEAMFLTMKGMDGKPLFTKAEIISKRPQQQ